MREGRLLCPVNGKQSDPAWGKIRKGLQLLCGTVTGPEAAGVIVW